MDFRLSEEQEMFRKSVRDYVNRELPKSWARELEKDEHTFPHELFGKLADAGFHAIGIGEEYGGQGGDIMTQMLLARELARSLAGLTWVWGITSFAGGKSVGIYGTPEQKQRHLPAIAAGREKWAIGFTEPGGGTDVLGAMRTVASRADGGWVINGQKTWSSMAHVADYILLLVRTTKDVAKQYQGVSLFILPTASDGVTIREIPKLGMRALGSCDVFLDDVFVADENLLGQPDQAWKMLLPTLNNERIMLSAFCVGILDGVLEDALRYVQEREAFGRKIGEFLALQHYIARAALPAGGDHGQGDRVRAGQPGRGPGHPDPRRDGLLGRDRHAALLAGLAVVPDRADHQRDGEELHRRGPGPAQVVLMGSS
jgi:acyl-CoA dehydrogenase